MPITQKQREKRKGHIGSSDVAGILGFDPFRSAADVWASKVYETDDLEPSLAMDLGNHLERGLLELGAKSRGHQIQVGGVMRVSRHNALFSAHPDALVHGKPIGYEAKVVGRHNPCIGEWGEDGSDEIPACVGLQVQQQMYVVCLSRVVVVAYIAGDFRTYDIERDSDLIDYIVPKCTEWWEKHVMGRCKPEGGLIDVEIFKRVRRRANTFAKVEKGVAQDYIDAGEEVKYAEIRRKACRALLMEQMGDAEAGDWGSEKVFTYLSQSSNKFDTDRFSSDHPELFSKYSKSSRYRVLRQSNRSKIDEYADRKN